MFAVRISSSALLYQILVLLAVVAAVCYAIPMSKYDPFLMDDPMIESTEFTPLNETMGMGNITALARSKRSCCGCCCCCCCWYDTSTFSSSPATFNNFSCCCCGKKKKRSVDGEKGKGQGSLSRRRRALHDLERWNYMQNTQRNVRSALMALL
ncbi:unnamed protein product [Gongylonema pulchrum]|uniref:Uncharacterized protein n=1 Tax=Gongylonema pulchrum TaxID=637853 RepID=A0A183DYP0_9BILA|nr:unnamed protein product [Gongylonema pulchrum]